MLYVHGNDTAVGMWLLRHRDRLCCPMVMDNHMVEMASQNPLRKLYRAYYRRFIAPIIIKNEIPVIRAMNDDYVERCLGVPLSLSPWISYGSDMLLFHPDKAAGAEFRRENGIAQDALVVLFAGKFDRVQGAGCSLAEPTCREISSPREIVYVMIGNAVGDYGAAVESASPKAAAGSCASPRRSTPSSRVFLSGSRHRPHRKAGQPHFFDMEACGVPMLSEDNNLNAARSDCGNGWLFRPDDADDFAAKLEMIVNLDGKELEKASEKRV